MELEVPSYSRTLRVIGRALEKLHINSFTLKKGEEDKYVVVDWEGSFLKSVSDRIWRRKRPGQAQSFPGETGAALVYTGQETCRLEAEERSKRDGEEVPNAASISLGLRVVGDFLDKRRAVTFEVAWSVESVTVKYQNHAHDFKEERFTAQNLHDLGVGMYLRRADRHVAR